MNKYEILYIIPCDVEDEIKNQVVEKFENHVKDLDGTVVNTEVWGLKKFAYEINRQSEGYYVLMNVECSIEAQIELDRLFRIDDNILRHMIVKK